MAKKTAAEATETTTTEDPHEGLESRPAVRADHATREERLMEGLRPFRVVLSQMADWAGGRTTVGVAEDAEWIMEPGEHGITFFTRIPGRPKNAYWVPWVAIRFVEFAPEK